MSKYYTATRVKNVFSPTATEPFVLSRSKIDLFIECPRCFFLDRRLGVSRPPGFPFTLNNAVDTLLKKEFDIHRANGDTHPLIAKYGIDAKPVAHESLNMWRENFKGIRFHHQPSNFIITGAIDDLWQNAKGEYIVVDYKATSKATEIVALDQDWHIGYKRQMEVYQWLFRQNGFPVSSTGYFVYCNGRTDVAAFDGKIEFAITLIPYTGDDSWIENVLSDIRTCLSGSTIPAANAECDYCNYRLAAVTKEYKQ